MSYFVYIHTTPSNKRYIGVTSKNVNKRWGNEGYGYFRNRHFYSAIQKYGWDNIEHKVFEVDTESEMFYLERYLISYYRSNNPKYGYNKSTGGEIGPVGCKHSDITKAKMRESHLGHRCSDETRYKIGKANKGHSVSIEVREKIRSANKGVTPPSAIRVSINDNTFPSITSAAKYIGVSYGKLYKLLEFGGVVYENYEIKKID